MAAANSIMFTSFLKGDVRLGGQGRAGLGEGLGKQTHPLDFPAFLSEVSHPVKRGVLSQLHYPQLTWAPLFQRSHLTSTVTMACGQDYSDEQQDEEQQGGQHIAQLLEEMCVALWDNDVDDAVASGSTYQCGIYR